MLNIAADHIAEREAKEAAERKAEQARAERIRQQSLLHTIIAEAERKMEAPVFVNDSAEHTYQIMKGVVERLASEYEHRMWSDLQGARKYPLELESAGAIAFFLGDQILAKLPKLADCMTSRDGRGHGFAEDRKTAVIEDCQARIREAKQRLAALKGEA